MQKGYSERDMVFLRNSKVMGQVRRGSVEGDGSTPFMYVAF